MLPYPAQVEDSSSPAEKVERVQACIFKVGDDCRQDVLALQVRPPAPKHHLLYLQLLQTPCLT